MGAISIKTIWIIEEGVYYNDLPYYTVVCRLKKIAVEKCKKDGFKYNKKQDLWCNDAELIWRHVIQTKFFV